MTKLLGPKGWAALLAASLTVVVLIPLRLAQQRAHSAGNARQLFRPDDDQRHRADQRHLGQSNINHACVACRPGKGDRASA